MSDGTEPKDIKAGYAVGYGKPPKATQFKPGKSGNPNGRPKGQPTTQQLLLEEAAKLVKIKVGEEIVQLSKHRALVRKLYNMALEGNLPAVRLVFGGLGVAEGSGVTAESELPLSDAELAMAAFLFPQTGGGENG